MWDGTTRFPSHKRGDISDSNLISDSNSNRVSMTKHSSTPFVMVSQFSREAARELGSSRLVWQSEVKKDVTFGAIPMNPDFDVDTSEVDYEFMLNDYVNIDKYIEASIEETNKLQQYLAGMNGIGNTDRANIWGKTVSIEVYRIHRNAISTLLQYKMLLRTKLKNQRHNHRRGRASNQLANKAISMLAAKRTGRDAEIITELRIAIGFIAKVYGIVIPKQFDAVLEESRDLIDKMTNDFIDKVGSDKIKKFSDNLHVNGAGTRQIARMVEIMTEISVDDADDLLVIADKKRKEYHDKENNFGIN